ncbi:MAG: hypothetical protein ACREUC_05465, partial [Steroidobacteraceae bacterium]
VCELPCGASVWLDTMIGIGSLDLTNVRELFSGRELTLEDTAAGRVLRVAGVLAEFPVAVLTGL